MKRALLVLLVAGVLLGAAEAKGKKKGKGKPVWPVPNPSFRLPGFVASSSKRQLSGVFGPRLKWGGGRYDHHEGFDFYAQYDTSTYPNGRHPVLSVLPGVVTQVISPGNPERSETGRKIVVTHALQWSKLGAPKAWGPVKTAYLHLSRISVKQGQPVKAGHELGRAGQSGYTTTTHLHFNVYRAGNRPEVNVNPARLFTPTLFPNMVVPIHKKTVQVQWIERDTSAGTALVRVLLARNAYGLDGFSLQIDKDRSRSVSFEHVTATQRQTRDTGDKGLFPNLRLYPFRYNGGGMVERLNNGNRAPSSWPVARYPLPNGSGVRLGFDILATNVPEKAKKLKLTVFSVAKKKVSFACKGFQAKR
jgi:hypothetical protein